MASIRGILNIQSLNELTSENVRALSLPLFRVSTPLPHHAIAPQVRAHYALHATVPFAQVLGDLGRPCAVPGSALYRSVRIRSIMI